MKPKSRAQSRHSKSRAQQARSSLAGGCLEVWSANALDVDRAKRAMVASMRDSMPANTYARGYYAATVDELTHSIFLLEELRRQAGLPPHRQPQDNIKGSHAEK